MSTNDATPAVAAQLARVGLGGDAGHTETGEGRAALREALGDSWYDEIIAKAMAAADVASHGYQVTRGNVDQRDVETILEAVMLDALSEAWQDGKFSEHSVDCRWNDNPNCICVNPYEPKADE